MALYPEQVVRNKEEDGVWSTYSRNEGGFTERALGQWSWNGTGLKKHRCGSGSWYPTFVSPSKRGRPRSIPKYRLRESNGLRLWTNPNTRRSI
jgi:hypothetical protein